MPLNITSASGKGQILGMGEWGDDDLIVDVERPTPAASLIVNDWFWGGQAPDATVIPWTWLTMPLELRADHPINSASITRVNQAASTATNPTSQATYGEFDVATTLNTISPDDAQNFADWLVTYYANPLVRCPTITLSLVHRTDEERWRILGREIGDRFILGPATVQDAPGHTLVLPVPAGLPLGAQSLVIEGIDDTSSVGDRIVEWHTAPLIGISPVVVDTFNRTVANDWGFADTGQDWALAGGVSSDYSVSGGAGRVSLPATGTNRFTLLADTYTDVDVRGAITVPVTATGGNINAYLIARFVDTSNDYGLNIAFRTDGTVDLLIRRTNTILTSASGVATYAPGVPLRARFQVVGTTLSGKAWTGGTEPPWQVTTTDATYAAGQVGTRSILDSGNSNTLPVVIGYDDFFVSIGTNPQNVEGPWFRLGQSKLDGPDAMPF